MEPRFERVVQAVGNLARPSVLYLAAWSSAIATVRLAFAATDLVSAAAFIGAAWGGVGVIYGAKALEEGRKAKADAEVRTAQAAAGGLPGDAAPATE